MSQSLSDVVIDACGLHKGFGRTRALNGLDLQVEAGEVHGFLGPNGAGKSTTIRAILGQLHLDEGRLTVFGRHPVRDLVTIHERLAYVPGDTVLWPGLTGGECVDLIGSFQGTVDRGRRAELIERFELDPTKRARTYSKGNRQKVALIAALSTRAELLLLDEPTSGLDPLMENIFQTVIRDLKRDGRTVLLSSHILDEVEALCDRVTIIRSGTTVATGTLESLRANTSVTIEATTQSTVPAVAQWRAQDDETTPSGLVATRLVVTPADMPRAVAAVAAQQPSSLVVRPPSLDELFLQHYGEAS